MAGLLLTIFDAIKEKRPNTSPNPIPKNGPIISILSLGCKIKKFIFSPISAALG